MTTKKELLDIIRKTCLRCCCGSYNDVRDCSTLDNVGQGKCPLYSFRFGKDPYAAKAGKNPFLKNKSSCASMSKSKIEGMQG